MNSHNPQIFTSDDKIVFAAQLNDGMRKLPLVKNWKHHPRVQTLYRLGIPVIAGYFRSMPGAGEMRYLSTEKFKALSPSRQAQWHPHYTKAIQISSTAKLIVRGNQAKLILTDLEDEHRSRYALGLDALKKLHKWGILEGAGPSSTEDIERHFNEYWKTNELEWNLWLTGEVGQQVFRGLEHAAISTMPQYKTTVYLSDGKRSQYRTKIYNKTAQQENRDTNLKVDRYKIEITLKADYFRKNELQSPRLFTTQPEIQQLPQINAALKRQIKRIYGKINALKIKRKLQKALGTTNMQACINAILSPNLTKTEQERPENHEKQQKYTFPTVKGPSAFYAMAITETDRPWSHPRQERPFESYAWGRDPPWPSSRGHPAPWEYPPIRHQSNKHINSGG